MLRSRAAGLRGRAAVSGARRQRMGQNAAPTPATNPGDIESWITDRKPLDVAAPASGNTGQMENWITDRLPLNVWAGRTA
jgi:hypothetical protein